MPLQIYKRGNVWHVRGTVGGARIRQSTGTAVKADAQRFASQLEAKAYSWQLNGPKAVLTMTDAIHLYLDADKPTRFLTKIATFWGNALVKDITAEAIRLSARKLYPQAQPATLNRQVIVPTAAIINHAAKLGLCEYIKVQRLAVDPKKKKPATWAWVQAFAAQANADGLQGLAALCVFMFGTGARVGQALALTWADIDMTAKTATLHTNKPTPWTRTAHLPEAVLAALAALPSNRAPSHQVFGYPARDSINHTWVNVARRAGIALLTPHSCRHGFATTMLQAGFDAKTVADAGGWRDVNLMLRVYAHALADKTVTNALFDTKLTQPAIPLAVTDGKQKEKQK